MASNDCLRLCGGTFFILFTRAMKDHGRTTGVLVGEHKRVTNKSKDAASISERNALKGLSRVYHPTMPDLAYSTEKSNATQFKKCRNVTSIPFANSELRSSFDDRVKNQYDLALKSMSDLVNAQIDVAAKGNRFVKALLELIDQDEYIDDDALFYVGAGGCPMKKKDLRGESHFCLEAFALGVWHYCVMNVLDNTVGTETYFNFYPSARSGGTGGRHEFVSSIGNNPSRLVALVPVAGYYGAVPQAEGQQEQGPIIDGYYSSYFRSVAKDISAVKTIREQDLFHH